VTGCETRKNTNIFCVAVFICVLRALPNTTLTLLLSASMSFRALYLSSLELPPPSQWPRNAEKRSKFGQDVLWLTHPDGRHLQPEALEPYRMIGDCEIDNILTLLEEQGKPLGPGDDLLAMMETEAAADNPSSTAETNDPLKTRMKTFYETYSRVPTWVNTQQLKLGQEVFITYISSIGLSLYYRSLVPGFSIPKIAAVLQATGYLAPPSSRERVSARLMDTGALLAAFASTGVDDSISNAADTWDETLGSQSTASDIVQAILPCGPGWKAALQVRILHAKVRHALLRSKRWDSTALGVPINQEDMAATLLAFSANALVGIEFVLGFAIPLRERLAYLAFWRYIGWLLGIPTVEDNWIEMVSSTETQIRPLDPCGPGWIQEKNAFEHAHAIFQSIIFHILEPDNTSVEIAHHLLRVGRQGSTKNNSSHHAKDSNYNMWFYFRCLQCRRFIGDPLADALQLPLAEHWYTRWYLWSASSAYLLVLRCYTFLSLPWSPLRPYIYSFHLRNLQRFQASWITTHEKRINAQHSGNNSKDNKMCPFSMVAIPVVR
jgi:hypothetical protein